MRINTLGNVKVFVVVVILEIIQLFNGILFDTKKLPEVSITIAKGLLKLFAENITQFVPVGSIFKMLLFPRLATYKLLYVSNTNPRGVFIIDDELNGDTTPVAGSNFTILLKNPELDTYKILLLSNTNPTGTEMSPLVKVWMIVPTEFIL